MQQQQQQQTVISFDVGTIHLAYCIFVNRRVVHWAVVNLLHKETQPAKEGTVNKKECCGVTAKGKPCKKQAQWMSNGLPWCNQHSPNKHTDLWTNAFLRKASKATLLSILTGDGASVNCTQTQTPLVNSTPANNDPLQNEPLQLRLKEKLVEIAKHQRRTPIVVKKEAPPTFHVPTIAVNLTAELDQHLPLFCGVVTTTLPLSPVTVLIENQMMDNMRTVQGMIVQYFACRVPSADIHFIHAINKLRHTDQAAPTNEPNDQTTTMTTEDGQTATITTITTEEQNDQTKEAIAEKETYKQRKALGIVEGTKWLQETDQDPQWLSLLTLSPKKDDLTDSLLQGVYFLREPAV
jgi:hypothetical protein